MGEKVNLMGEKVNLQHNEARESLLLKGAYS